MPKLLCQKTFCKDLKEVTSTKPIAKRKFHPNGLFSEQIFGPIKNYTCQCNTYHGISKSGGTCPICGVDIINSIERRRRFAKITLPISIVNPIFYDLLINLGGVELKKVMDILMKDENSFLYIHNEDYVATTDISLVPAGARTYERTEAMFQLVKNLSTNLADDGINEWKMVRDNIDKLLLDEIIVIPADLRPPSKGIESAHQKADTINRFYTQLLTKREIMLDTLIDIKRDKLLYYQYYIQVQKDVNELYNHILEKLSKKEGLIRGNILGKRIDFSGRAVIIPDPLLTIDYCVLPYLMVLELYKLQIAKRLIEKAKFKMLNAAKDFIDKCIEISSPALFDITSELIQGEVCLLNRQPSLHRLGMIGFYFTISLDTVIKIHPLACAGYNADFDGDQMAVYIPITEGAKQEIIEKCLMSKNFLNASNGSLAPKPAQDIILGVYTLTNNQFENLATLVECKRKMITEGRQIFNSCLPEDYPLIDDIVASKELNEILNNIKEQYSSNVTAIVLDEIKKIGFKYSTLFGATMSLDKCHIPNIEEFKETIYEGSDVKTQLERINSPETVTMLKNNFDYSYMIESGSRGSWDQARQIILSRGFISNFDLEILPDPIKSSLMEGLTKKEFFNSTYGCRKGLLDVALNTGTSGYLSRKLIFALTNLESSVELDDCGTSDTFELFVSDEKKAQLLIHRYFKKDDQLHLITRDNYLSMVGEILHLRSPIFCKSMEVCHKCYGDLWKHIHSKYIGILSAQALGECNTQLVLRTFHTSGVASATSEGMHQEDIVGDLSNASKCLHNVKDSTYKTIVDNLYKIYTSNRNIYHVHFECIASQLMWVGYHKWRIIEDRDSKVPEYQSIQTVPSYESWLLGLAFSRPRQHILRGVLHTGNYSGIMDKLLLGDSLS